MTVLLLVEDDDDVCAALSRVFTRAGFTVVTAADGIAALKATETQRPDVVLTDLDMPRMNGLQLCRAIRQHADLRDIPVAILSGSLLPDDPRAAAEHTCGTFLKPFTNDALVAAVRELGEHGEHDHDEVPSRCPAAAAAGDRRASDRRAGA